MLYYSRTMKGLRAELSDCMVRVCAQHVPDHSKLMLQMLYSTPPSQQK